MDFIDEDQPQTAHEPLTRQRARKACFACRQRKRKCDSQQPCSMCTRYGYACHYPHDRSRLKPLVQSPVPNLNHALSIVTSPTSAHGTNGNTSDQSNLLPQGQKDYTSVTPRRPDIDTEDEGAPDTAPPFADRGLLDPVKFKFVGQSSVSAFARNLGIELQSANPPSLHSFGWNCGIRPEENSTPHKTLRELISLTDLVQYTAVYFSIVHPVFEILEQKVFKQRCDTYWDSPEPDIVFGSVISGVVALGSFMCVSRGHPKELDLVQYAKDILEDPAYTRKPTLDQVASWILRTLYLRSTTRPQNAWLASCATLHLAEATGLHQEASRVLLTTDHSPGLVELLAPEKTRRLFWAAWFINAMVSYEYSRTPVTLINVTCRSVSSGSSIAQLVQIAKTIPTSQPHTPSLSYKAELNQAIEDLMAIEDIHPFVALTKADLCFCIYRRLYLFKEVLHKEVVSKIIELGNNAAKAGLHLAQQTQPWWQLVGCCFQYVCVLLALDTADSLANVKCSLKALEDIVHIFNTPVTLEALATARVLVNDAKGRKRRDLLLLESADIGDSGVIEPQNNIDLNWDQFFDPSYATFFNTPGVSHF